MQRKWQAQSEAAERLFAQKLKEARKGYSISVSKFKVAADDAVAPPTMIRSPFHVNGLSHAVSVPRSVPCTTWHASGPFLGCFSPRRVAAGAVAALHILGVGVFFASCVASRVHC